MKNDYMVVTFKCIKNDINRLREIAREISYIKKTDILYTDLIRQSIRKEILSYSEKQNVR